MGKVLVQVTVTNHRDPTCRKRFSALVDTGASGLVLPLAWREELGDLEASKSRGRQLTWCPTN